MESGRVVDGFAPWMNSQRFLACELNGHEPCYPVGRLGVRKNPCWVFMAADAAATPASCVFVVECRKAEPTPLFEHWVPGRLLRWVVD